VSRYGVLIGKYASQKKTPRYEEGMPNECPLSAVLAVAAATGALPSPAMPQPVCLVACGLAFGLYSLSGQYCSVAKFA
jgi:hypothetical protein